MKLSIEIDLDHPLMANGAAGMAVAALRMIEQNITATSVSPNTDLRENDPDNYCDEGLDKVGRIFYRAEVIEGTIDQAQHVKTIRSQRDFGEHEMRNLDDA